MSNIIVAFDLGTSHITGLAGRIDPDGITILASGMEGSASIMRRGNIFNTEEVAAKIKRIVLKLENQLDGQKIKRVYVGIGGHTIRSIDYVVTTTQDMDTAVTEETIRYLMGECRKFRPAGLDVLEILPPTYYIDNQPVNTSPIGVYFKRIEARFKIIVGSPTIQDRVKKCFEKIGIEIAGLVITPLALSDFVLSPENKQQGCALVGFGGGVTSVTVFKKGALADLFVIPFGGSLVTKDIMSLKVVQEEAERLKRDYGSAILAKNDNGDPISLNISNYKGRETITQKEINNAVEARVAEIVEYVETRLRSQGNITNLDAGIYIAGGASLLRNLPELLRAETKKDVQRIDYPKGKVLEGENLAKDYRTISAVAILALGTQDCCEEQKAVVVDDPKEDEQPPVKPPKEKKPKKKIPFINNLFGDLKGAIEGAINDME